MFGVLDRPQQFLNVEVPAVLAELDGLSAREGTERLRQLLFFDHRRALDEHGDEKDLPPQRGLELEADEVLRVVEAALALGAAGVDPVAADDEDEHFARIHRARERFNEVIPWLELVDVAEDAVRAKVLAQPVEEAAGVAGRIFAPVAHEDPRHRAPPIACAALGPQQRSIPLPTPQLRACSFTPSSAAELERA